MVRTKKKLVNLVIIFLTILKFSFSFSVVDFGGHMSHTNTNTKNCDLAFDVSDLSQVLTIRRL